MSTFYEKFTLIALYYPMDWLIETFFVFHELIPRPEGLLGGRECYCSHELTPYSERLLASGMTTTANSAANCGHIVNYHNFNSFLNHDESS